MNQTAIPRQLVICNIFFAGMSVWLITGCSTRQGCYEHSASGDRRTVELKDQTVQIGCSMCIFKIPDSKDCSLAAEVNGKHYLVDGSGIDDHGDAHAADGLCNTARPAKATGRVEGHKLIVTELTVADRS